MELLQKLLEHQYAPIALMGFGGLLALVGGIKVARKGLAVAFWFAVASFGWSTLMYGFKGSDFDFMSVASQQINNVSSLTPEVSNEVLQVLCAKLRDITGS
jgi:hypothetical protein